MNRERNSKSWEHGRPGLACLIMFALVACVGSIFGRPAEVPREAFWAGNFDGGAWIRIASVQGDQFRADIWFDTGAKWMRGWFQADSKDDVKLMTPEWLKNKIAGFDGTNFYLKGSRNVFRLRTQIPWKGGVGKK